MHQNPDAKLILEDGTIFNGYSFGYKGSVSGEVVFNTAMTGYPESLTDPSYKGQILTLTYPLVGNYGVPGQSIENKLLKYFESDEVHISALIISDYSFKYNHWNAAQSLDEWLRNNQVPGIYGIDTRELTKITREKGALLGKVIIDGQDCDQVDPNTVNLVADVSTGEKKIYGKGKHKILMVDCGVKNNIIRYFLEKDSTVIRVPWDYNFLDEDYDGLFISNGPGNPEMCDATIDNLKRALQGDKPTFGICLGHQLLALALGASTLKLKFGHRGANQPVRNLLTGRVEITSQNHGFAVDIDSLKKAGGEPTHINLNDQTLEGFRHGSEPIFAVQYHPEASP
ncbi:MAG: glutamine-hydrolyzing carbamoyl-phosphate synthase small subunit, partial [Bacteroidales bacterium]|nr:glutamine-hydrolyzing carbamoyl-phosphate synthase small subunit [Bacteroidales bacterium]